MRYVPLSQLISIEEDNGLWFIVDKKHMAGLYEDGQPKQKLGPYPTEESARLARESLYHIIYGDYS